MLILVSSTQNTVTISYSIESLGRIPHIPMQPLVISTRFDVTNCRIWESISFSNVSKYFV